MAPDKRDTIRLSTICCLKIASGGRTKDRDLILYADVLLSADPVMYI